MLREGEKEEEAKAATRQGKQILLSCSSAPPASNPPAVSKAQTQRASQQPVSASQRQPALFGGRETAAELGVAGVGMRREAEGGRRNQRTSRPELPGPVPGRYQSVSLSLRSASPWFFLLPNQMGRKEARGGKWPGVHCKVFRLLDNLCQLDKMIGALCLDEKRVTGQI